MSITEKKRVIRLAVVTLLGVVVAFAVYFIYLKTGIGFKCLIYEVTGFKCAGCGNTHALTSLLKLDVLDSLKHNYIYPLELCYIGWVYLFSAREYIRTGKFNYIAPRRILDVILLVLIVLWIPLRNILGV